MKKILNALVITILAAIIITNPIMANTTLPQKVELTLNSKHVVIDGLDYQLDVVPVVIDGVTLLPIRFVSQTILGATVGWDNINKELNIFCQGSHINLWLGKNYALVNGENIALPQPPIIQSDRTLVPLRFLSENMGLDVRYEPATKKIHLTSTSSIERIAPIAEFYILEKDIIAGQKLSIIDNSYHPEGHGILDWVWELELENGQRYTINDLQSKILTKNVGKHILRLKVKDTFGVWSQWAEQDYQVYPNQPPVITLLEADKTRVAQGEKIKFSYDSIDEQWDNIEEERWSYRFYDNNGKLREIIGKPEVLFGERTYDVVLRIKDSFNNWSEEASVEIKVSDKEEQSEFEYRFSNPRPGEIILNSDYTNYNLLPDADWEINKDGPVLLVSNSPETVLYPGITYQDEVKGPARIYYYHKNATGKNSLLKVWVENKEIEPVKLVINKSGMAGPTTDEMHLGQSVAFNYLLSEEVKELVIDPGQKIALNAEQANKIIRPGELLSGMMDIDTTGTMEITVAMVDVNYTDELNQLEILPSDGQHPRGTYRNGNITIDVFADKKRFEKVLLGRGLIDGYFLKGIDALTGNEVVNKGNYGVLYTINFYSDVNIGVFLNARGTSFKGAVKSFDNKIYRIPSAGVLDSSLFPAVLGVVSEGEKASIVYTPPGGSDTPLVIGLVPESKW